MACTCLLLCTAGRSLAVGPTSTPQETSNWPPTDSATRSGQAVDLLSVEPTPVRLEHVADYPPETSAGELSYFDVAGLAVGADGEMVVADPLANRLAVLAPDGTLRAHLGGPGQGPGEFVERDPYLVAVTESFIVGAGFARPVLNVYGATRLDLLESHGLGDAASLRWLGALSGDLVAALMENGPPHARPAPWSWSTWPRASEADC